MASSFTVSVHLPQVFTYAQHTTAFLNENQHMLEKSQILGDQVVSIIIQF